ncbi:MAG: hypothetical protein IJX62_06715 [Clostridia bacterium]|nr:hypothetical protein [Clostridia bacterium]
MKRKITSLIIVLAMVLTAFVGVISVAAETPTITVLDGASIRCAEPSGIRFISQISTADAEAATEIGTYIFPYAEYKASGAETPQAYFATEGAKFVKIVANEGKHTDGDVTYIYAALVDIKETNYGRDFAAVAYVTTGSDTQYSAFDADKNVRNIREVAVAAYNDYSATEGAVDGPYTYKYQVAEGKWSCYSEAQREVIATYDNALFRLTMDANGNVWNGAANGPAIGDYNATNTPKIVDGTNQTITFEGTSAATSSYQIPTVTIADEISDGFSFEVMLKVTNDVAYWQNGYMGIFDFEEAGGWGLVLYDEGDDNNGKVNLTLEFAYGPSSSGRKWLTIAKEINVSTTETDYWYHCVVSYNASENKLQMYVDGELVQSLDVPDNFVFPVFDQRTGEEYICLGGCTAGWEGSTRSTGIYGFDGAINICNLYSDPVTAEEAAAMYAEATK